MMALSCDRYSAKLPISRQISSLPKRAKDSVPQNRPHVPRLPRLSRSERRRSSNWPEPSSTPSHLAWHTLSCCLPCTSTVMLSSQSSLGLVWANFCVIGLSSGFRLVGQALVKVKGQRVLTRQPYVVAERQVDTHPTDCEGAVTNLAASSLPSLFFRFFWSCPQTAMGRINTGGPSTAFTPRADFTSIPYPPLQ
ncbi:hypothetical protein CGRA01v4_07805 [Colletotrichum graminicola]|nr:hypothetical protein CGRA01v4_07805 [Colletotrichum graminicola]